MDNELDVKCTIGAITSNYDELKNYISKEMVKYQNLVVTEDKMTECKKVKAKLNAFSIAIDNERKKIKKEYSKPLTDFEVKMKELCYLVSETSSRIANQIKTFENKELEEKMALLRDYFKMVCASEINSEVITFEEIYNPKWENKSYSLESCKNEIFEKIKNIKMTFQTIESLYNGADKSFLKCDFLQTLDLNKSVINLQQHKELQKKIDEIRMKSQDDNQKKYSIKFGVTGTKDQLLALSEFLKENGYDYQRLE